MPIAGATAVLEQGPTADGPWHLADPSSPGITPHRNPEKTLSDGGFHWDVISDYYEITASAEGCHAPGDPAQATVSTPPLPVPPPQVGLDLVLQCAHEAPPPRPVVASLSAAEASESGGAELQIVGSHFTPSARVRFGPAFSPAVTYESPEALLARVPAGRGIVGVYVGTQGGTSAPAPGARLVYRPEPVVTMVNPPSGPPGGGTTVTVHGTGLAGALVVRLGQRALSDYTVEGDDAIEVVMPPGSPGALDITVTTPLGTSTRPPADRYTYRVPPPKPLVGGHLGQRLMSVQSGGLRARARLLARQPDVS